MIHFQLLSLLCFQANNVIAGFEAFDDQVDQSKSKLDSEIGVTNLLCLIFSLWEREFVAMEYF